MQSEYEGALAIAGDAPADEAREASPVPGPADVKDLLDMDSMFKCPIIGSCLSTMEQKKLLRKASITYDDKNEFEIHEIFVALSDTENELSRRLTRQRLVMDKALINGPGSPCGNFSFVLQYGSRALAPRLKDGLLPGDFVPLGRRCEAGLGTEEENARWTGMKTFLGEEIIGMDPKGLFDVEPSLAAD